MPRPRQTRIPGLAARGAVTIALAIIIAGCVDGSMTAEPGGQTTASQATRRSPSAAPTGTGPPTPSAESTATAARAGPFIAPGRDAIVPPDRGDQIVVGRLADGGYEVIATSPSEPGVIIGAIADLADRLPPPWDLADEAPLLSATGFLVMPLVEGPTGDVNLGAAVFDLIAPTAPPAVVDRPGGPMAIAGDRLWVETDEDAFAVYELPDLTTLPVRMADGSTIKRVVGFDVVLSISGDAVLGERHGGQGPTAWLTAVDGTGRPAGDEPLLSLKGRAPLGDQGAEIRPAVDCADPGAGTDLCVAWPEGAVIGVGAGDVYFGPEWAMSGSPEGSVALEPGGPCDAAWEANAAAVTDIERRCLAWPPGTEVGVTVPGTPIDAGWDPSEPSPVWVSSDGLGTIVGGTARKIVRLDRWTPTEIAGFWSNTVILGGTGPSLQLAVTGPDAITPLPMPPSSLHELPGDRLLEVVASEDASGD